MFWKVPPEVDACMGKLVTTAVPNVASQAASGMSLLRRVATATGRLSFAVPFGR